MTRQFIQKRSWTSLINCKLVYVLQLLAFLISVFFLWYLKTVSKFSFVLKKSVHVFGELLYLRYVVLVLVLLNRRQIREERSHFLFDHAPYQKMLSWYHNPRSASHRPKTWGDMDHRIMIHDHDPSHVNSYDPWSWSWKFVWWGPWIMILIWPLCQIGSWSSKVHGHDPEPPWVPTCATFWFILSSKDP